MMLDLGLCYLHASLTIDGASLVTGSLEETILLPF